MLPDARFDATQGARDTKDGVKPEEGMYFVIIFRRFFMLVANELGMKSV